MPELPEVESLRLSLLKVIKGQTIIGVKVLKPKLVSAKGTVRTPSEVKVIEFIQGLTQEKITDIDRIAKNIIFRFESGKLLVIHLKMTGQLVYKPNKENTSFGVVNTLVSGGHPIQESELELPHKHSHVIFELENGVLYYNDVRMFGYLLYFNDWKSLENEKHFEKLGIDPLSPEFSLEYFKNALNKKTGKLKSIFLSQEVVIGLGNIYADEVCFAAKVRPDRNVNTLKNKEITALYKEIKRIVPLAVSLGGSSVANYLLADGSRGNYAREHKVYGKGGKPCQVCGTTLSKIVMNSRTTVYCPVCQR